MVGKVFPLTASTNSLSMKSCLNLISGTFIVDRFRFRFSGFCQQRFELLGDLKRTETEKMLASLFLYYVAAVSLTKIDAHSRGGITICDL